ncbi:MAG TPA: phosphatase PAP2 family protein [Spirochaetota bacterium]|nr:phosphatase PAP2 family protein [Spirochaetota bacterium]
MTLFTDVDKTLFTLINTGWSNSAFDIFMPLISHLADPVTIWLWIPLLGLLAYRKFPGLNMHCSNTGDPAAAVLPMRYLFSCLNMALIYVVNAGIYQLLKHLVHRPRPFVIQDAVVRAQLADMQFFSSFPSGHAANAFMIAVILSAIYTKKRPVFYFTAFLVALSRIYLGVHYPLDVIAGALLGLSLTWLILRLRPINDVFSAGI